MRCWSSFLILVKKIQGYILTLKEYYGPVWYGTDFISTRAARKRNITEAVGLSWWESVCVCGQQTRHEEHELLLISCLFISKFSRTGRSHPYSSLLISLGYESTSGIYSFLTSYATGRVQFIWRDTSLISHKNCTEKTSICLTKRMIFFLCQNLCFCIIQPREWIRV